MRPTTLSFTEMLVNVTLPQLVTAPLMICGWPTTAVLQVLVTVMHGLSDTMQVLVDLAEAGVPQMLVPEAVTMLVLPPHTAVIALEKVMKPPGARVGTLVMVPMSGSVTMTFVSVTSPQLVTAPVMNCRPPTTALEQLLATVMHGLSVVMQVLVALAEAGVPQMLNPEAVTTLVLPPQTAVTVLL